MLLCALTTPRAHCCFWGRETGGPIDDEGKPRILVVEDEVGIGRLISAYLESVWYEVHHETRGEAALLYAAAHRPELVILDLCLPDIHGYQVCHVLPRLYSMWARPIMILSSLDANIDQLRGYASGADAYLTKPFEPPQLLPTVTRLLGQTPN